MKHSLKTSKDGYTAVIIYTDGSCLKNPGGPSGYGYFINALMFGPTPNYIPNKFMELKPTKTIEIKDSAGYRASTANRMELMGIVKALNKLIELEEFDDAYPINLVALYSDSKYAVEGINSWAKTWEKNNWLTSSSKEVLNKDLWKDILRLLRVLEQRGISFDCIHAHGHRGINENELCDKMAKEAALSPKNVDDVYEAEVIANNEL